MTARRDQELREGLDALQGDMAEHQRMFRGEVTGEANRALAANTFAELERQGVLGQVAEAAATPAPPADVEKTEHVLNGVKYTRTKEPDFPSPERFLPHLEKQLVVKALKRLRLLLSLRDSGVLGAPSWNTRAKAVMAYMFLPGKVVRFAQELDTLLDESNKYFGDWKVDPEPKIIVGA